MKEAHETNLQARYRALACVVHGPAAATVIMVVVVVSPVNEEAAAEDPLVSPRVPLVGQNH